jgi:hypothetical protein
MRGAFADFLHPMKKNTNTTPSREITRREFVGRALTTAGLIAGAPAFLRGQNLNNKLNIAFIGSGGRASASLSELTIVPGRDRAQTGGKPGDSAAVLRWRRIQTKTSRCSAT